MDADELDRICTTLTAAIAEARVLAQGDPALGAATREVIKHAREMHELLSRHR